MRCCLCSYNMSCMPTPNKPRNVSCPPRPPRSPSNPNPPPLRVCASDIWPSVENVSEDSADRGRELSKCSMTTDSLETVAARSASISTSSLTGNSAQEEVAPVMAADTSKGVVAENSGVAGAVLGDIGALSSEGAGATADVGGTLLSKYTRRIRRLALTSGRLACFVA